ncbi:MAG: outer membrane beta-barrel protein [Bacteroidota bacterium]
MKRILFSIFIFCSSAVFGQEAQEPDNGRALASPFPAPPFPGSDWVGSPVIGAPYSIYNSPLQKALFGKNADSSKIKIYGWVDASGNISTSKKSNFPMAYGIAANKLVLDQLVLRIERYPNTVQKDHIDWGFRLSNVYGIDYRYTMMKGIFSDQLFKKNNLYGYDPTEAYAILYIPKVAEGMILRVGRYISPPDIEAQLSPDNYLSSHSLMFSYDPFTFTGVLADIRLSKYFTLRAEVQGGNDMAFWTNSSRINGGLMARWVSKNNNNSIYGGINSLGKGQYRNGHDDLQQLVATWGHRFGKKVHMMTEAYYMWQKDGALGGSAVYGPNKYYALNSLNSQGELTIVPGISKSIGFVNYFQVQTSAKGYISIRNGFLNDVNGQRTGFATLYTDHTIGYVHYFSPLVFMRPEVRYERAYEDGVTPYDLGTKKDQFSATMDLVVKF